MNRPAGAPATVNLAHLGFDQGAHLLVQRGLSGLRPGEHLEVTGHHPALLTHLRAWCRGRGHLVHPGPDPLVHPAAYPLVHPAADPLAHPGPDPLPARGGDQGEGRDMRPDGERHRDTAVRAVIVRGPHRLDRWAGARRAGGPAPREIVERPDPGWGLAARGALVEDGAAPAPGFDLSERDLVWADIAPGLYAHAASAQWDPATAVPWDTPFELPAAVEEAVVQVMTYLVENEQAALVVPARMLARIHPHFREVVQLLAVQAADEARHVEVFTRRALLKTGRLGTSSAGGRASLATLLAEPDFALASFLLSVLGEGSFLSLLAFLERHAPDPVTRSVVRLAHQDEARHVAFGVAHLRHQASVEPGLRGRLRGAVERRHDALRDTAGLNQDVLDALVVLAAGSWEPADVARGHRRVGELVTTMDEARQRLLIRVGFAADEAAELSSLHTRNFM